jgi:alkanesulfonate monooxygenase SsuD/methylene tetrahydromethanopterin reductase-like flavin-dependent oxidoreductase (luciferase family)
VAAAHLNAIAAGTAPSPNDEEATIMDGLKLGVCPWVQATEWPPLLDFVRRVDRLGYEHVWSWDHVHAIYGDPYQPIFEGWTVLAAWAMATERAKLGLLVGANTFRNPGVFAKAATTVDHISGGRAICGIGGAWFAFEHEAHGIEFGTGFGQRLDWLDESAGAMRRLLDGEEVTSAEGGRYRFDRLVHHPTPVQSHLPMLIGGVGERKTLRTVAKYADMWNAFGTPEELAHKDAVLRTHCEAVGRNEAEIERTVGCKIVVRDTEDEARRVWAAQLEANRTPYEEESDIWLGSPAQVAAKAAAFAAAGFRTIIAEMPAPYDVETVERLVAEVKPLAERLIADAT